MSDAIIRAWVSEEPPMPKSSGDMCEQQGPLASVVGTSSAAIQIAHAPTGNGECFVTFVVSANPVRLQFGADNTVANADANCVLFPVGKYRLRVTAANSWFKHFGVTGVAEIDLYRSSR